MKVLIISYSALSATANNGKTMASLFKNISINDIAQLYFGIDEKPDLSACKNYYRVTAPDQLQSILKFSFTTTNSHMNLVNSITETPKDDCIMEKLRANSKSTALFKEILWRLRLWDSTSLNEWIKSFNPDIIFSVLGGSVFDHNIVRAISKRYKIPYTVFFTDDYVLNDNSSNILQRLHYLMRKRTYQQTISNASACFVIGDKMKNDYSTFFNRHFGTLVNSVDFSRFNSLSAQSIDKTKDIIISFIGGIHLNRWVSIVRLGEIINEINEEYNLKIKIYVYAIKKPNEEQLTAFNTVGVCYGGSLDYDGMLTTMDNSHFLLHVESFDTKNRIYTKYSISTKIPEYLASKRGIIAFGPHEVASIQIFNESGFGCCLTDLDSDMDIKHKLLEYISLYNSYDFEKPYKYAYDNFNVDTVSNKLLTDLQAIIDSK